MALRSAARLSSTRPPVRAASRSPRLHRPPPPHASPHRELHTASAHRRPRTHERHRGTRASSRRREPIRRHRRPCGLRPDVAQQHLRGVAPMSKGRVRREILHSHPPYEQTVNHALHRDRTAQRRASDPRAAGSPRALRDDRLEPRVTVRSTTYRCVRRGRPATGRRPIVPLSPPPEPTQRPPSPPEPSNPHGHRRSAPRVPPRGHPATTQRRSTRGVGTLQRRRERARLRRHHARRGRCDRQHANTRAPPHRPKRSLAHRAATVAPRRDARTLSPARTCR